MNNSNLISFQYPEVTVHNYFMLYSNLNKCIWPLANDSSKIRISNQRKENSEKFSIFILGISENFLFRKI